MLNGKHLLLSIALAGLGGLLCLPLHGQIVIDQSNSPKALVNEILLGRRIKTRNIRYGGSPDAIARFIDPSDSPLIGDGIVLSTGHVFDIPGPNKHSGSGISLGRRGSRALQAISKGQTYDAAVLEFEFMAAREELSFNFIFASEEYTEYVFSQFNDVFAFFISGPGIQGQKNLAVVPRDKRPITVNNINHLHNRRNYIDNNIFDRSGRSKAARMRGLDVTLLDAIEFDGMTTLLKAQTRVIPGKVYKIRIEIADVGDARYDSAVFLEAGSFTSLPLDPVERMAILREEYADVRRRYDPVVVGKTPQPTGTFAEEQVDEVPTPDSLPAETTPINVKWTSAVEFNFDVATLSESAKTLLDGVAARLKKEKGSRLLIQGHTDSQGSNAYNDRLSRERAEAVRAYLLAKGVSAEQLKTEWFGLKRPLSSNATDQGRAKNRRVEIQIF